MYTPVNNAAKFPELELTVQGNWQKHNIFQQSIRGDKDYIFYDGPPFANGLPHYGHLLTGFVKDIFARYHTMQGERVERRFGWDCHGLPAEMGAEKELHISGRKAIMDFGIDKFNAHCRDSVMKYTHIWEEYINRQGRWVDFKDDYKTMDTPYMESVIWAFKQLYDKGLIYQAMRVMPYSWACETPVSDFETRMDNSYRQKESKSLFLKFKLKTESTPLAQFAELYAVAWTTTPWTLPSNLALAVGADIDYVVVAKDGQHYLLAQELHTKFLPLLGDKVVATFKGSELNNIPYEPPFNYFIGHKNAFRILTAEFVTTIDGTGIVHIAPGFGEDDQALCKQHDIELVCPVDSAGRFEAIIEDYKGLQVFEANDEIIKALKEKGLWLKTEQYLHNYPHCWRTDTPLIYKAVPSWYLRVTEIRDRMVKNNQEINWIPGHIKDGLFGKWLENARDWSISRNRFWGCPVPIWQSDDPRYPCTRVFGSIQELNQAFGVPVDDLHMPFIDTLTMPNPEDPTGQSRLRRVPEVFDCWFESGSMPFAQLNYPFSNKEKFEKNFPADFIVEYVGQTRGWFYTLLVLSTALFDRPPFLNCICHGVILGDGGQKLSKRLKNYPDPNDVFENYGADALRWYLVSSSVMRGLEIEIDQKGDNINNALRASIKPLWNAYNFYVLYANADKVEGKLIEQGYNLLDNYILAKLQTTVESIEKYMDEYNTPDACVVAEQFFEILNNWYIRRSRERFWTKEHNENKAGAYNVLYTVLLKIAQALAPLLPHITEVIYSNLVARGNALDSIHLTPFPKFKNRVEKSHVEQMERVREACTTALAIRNDIGVRIRQPLASVTFIGVSNTLVSEELKELVLDEINVKNWVNLAAEEIEQYANYLVKVHFAKLGSRLPHKVKEVVGEVKRNNWQLKDGRLHIAEIVLEPQEFDLLLEPKGNFGKNLKALPTNDGLVLLDPNITDELRQEGYTRDFIRVVQSIRKERNFEITDRISIQYHTEDQTVSKALAAWKEEISIATLADSCVAVDDNSWHTTEHKHMVDESIVYVKVDKRSQ